MPNMTIKKDLIAKIKTGKLGGETYVLHLNNDGLKISLNSGYQLPADAKAAADAAIAGIKDGSIKVEP